VVFVAPSWAPFQGPQLAPFQVPLWVALVVLALVVSRVPSPAPPLVVLPRLFLVPLLVVFQAPWLGAQLVVA
jgi:hypothetical protein